MRPWSHLFPDILPAIPAGMPDPTVIHHVRRATQEFCRRTRAWREKLEPVRTRAGGRDYDLEFPPMAELVRIEGATLAGETLALSRAGFGCGRYVATPDGKMAELSFAPAAGLDLVIDASLQPSHDAVGIEDALYDRYADVIAEGAIARLANDPLKADQFLARCDIVKTSIWRGMAAVRPRAVPNYF